MTGCNVPGCVGDRASLGMCDFHYRRHRRGAPLVTEDERAAFEAEIAAAQVEDEAYYEPLPAAGTYRVTDHRCGECAWQGTGRSDCRNRVKKLAAEREARRVFAD